MPRRNSRLLRRRRTVTKTTKRRTKTTKRRTKRSKRNKRNTSSRKTRRYKGGQPQMQTLSDSEGAGMARFRLNDELLKNYYMS